MQLARRQQDSGNDRIRAACTRTARLWRRSSTCSGLVAPLGQGKITESSVQLHPARRAVEGCPEHEGARYSGPDEIAMGEVNKLIEQKVITKTVEVHLDTTRWADEAVRSQEGDRHTNVRDCSQRGSRLPVGGAEGVWHRQHSSPHLSQLVTWKSVATPQRPLTFTQL